MALAAYITCPLMEHRVKRCAACGRWRSMVSNFIRTKRDGFLPRCNECRNTDQRESRAAHPVRWRRYTTEYRKRSGRDRSAEWAKHLHRQYGVTTQQWDAMFAAQAGGCAVCGVAEERGRRLSVDHDHSCCPGKKSCGKCVRGLLCGDCNRALGLLRDDLARIDALSGYLTSPTLAGQVGLGL